MRGSIPLIVVGLLFGSLGWWVGYNEGKKIPCEDIVLEEISNIQRDIIQCQATNLTMLVRIVYLEDWRNSILFKPPQILKKELKDAKRIPKGDN